MTNDNSNPPTIALPGHPPCSPSELRRLKVFSRIVFGLCAIFFSMIFTFENFPRSFVDRMNVFLAPVVVIALVVCAYALWRFRKACIAWR